MSDERTSNIGDRALDMVRANPRDDEAWTQFYMYFRPQVAKLLYRLGAKADVKDVTQDVFHRFLRYSPWRRDWSALPNRW